MTLLFAIAGDLHAQVTNNPVDWVGGDVFAGSTTATGAATYQVWHSGNPTASKPSYAVEQTITDAPSVGAAAGCGFDLAYRFFGTNVTNTLVDRYSIANAHPLVEQLNTPLPRTAAGASPTPPPNANSVALDSGANLFIGYAGGVSGGMGTIEQWAKDPNTGKYTIFKNSFHAPVDNSGPGWIDLAKDGTTIFYTSQGRKIYTLDTSHGAPGVATLWADLSTLNGNLSHGTLYAIRILGPSGNGNDGVLVADKGNVKLVKASNGVITSVTVFKFGSLSNLQALSLDLSTNVTGTTPGGGTTGVMQLGSSQPTFWVGDATATSNNLVRYNISTGKTEATLSTGVGVGGVCVDGAFNAAQFASQQPNPAKASSPPNFQTQTFPLTPDANQTATLNFTSPFTGETVTATLRNLQNPVTITLRDSLVLPVVGMSDPTVYFLNPGAPGTGSTIPGPIVTRPGNWPCDPTLTIDAGYTTDNVCEVLSFEANPNSGFSQPEMIINPTPGALDTTPNLNVLSNEADDVTTGVVLYPTLSRNCVLTVHQMPTTGLDNICSITPADGSTLSKSSGNSTITFSIDAVPAGQSCTSSTSNNNTPTNLMPLLIIEQLPSNSAPLNIPVLIAGNSGGPPIMTLSGNTYQLQVKTTDMTVGNYLATVIDLSGNAPVISAHFTLTK